MVWECGTYLCGPVVASHEQGNEPQSLIKVWEFLDCLTELLMETLLDGISWLFGYRRELIPRIGEVIHTLQQHFGRYTVFEILYDASFKMFPR